LKKVKCPNCGKESLWEGNPFRPFCSEKCKMSDLYRWLSEEYRLEEELGGKVVKEDDSGS